MKKKKNVFNDHLDIDDDDHHHRIVQNNWLCKLVCQIKVSLSKEVKLGEQNSFSFEQYFWFNNNNNNRNENIITWPDDCCYNDDDDDGKQFDFVTLSMNFTRAFEYTCTYMIHKC